MITKNPLLRFLSNRLFWQNTAILAASNLIVAILGLVRVPILTQLISKDEMGMLGVLGSVLPFVQLLSLSGFDNANYHFVAKGILGAFRVTLITRLKWSVLGGFGLLLAGGYWFYQGEGTLAGLFVISALMFPLTTALMCVSSTLGAKEDFLRLFWFRVGGAVSKYTGFFVLLLIPWLSPQVVWYSLTNQIILGVIQTGFAIWLIRKIAAIGRGSISPVDRKELMRYGSHMTVLGSLSVFQTQIDSLLVGWLMPLTVMADYSIAQIVYSQSTALWSIYYSLRYPKLVQAPRALRLKKIVSEMVVFEILITLLGVALGFGLTILVPILLPPEYNSSLPFIHWLIAAFVVATPGFFADLFFRTCQDQRSQYQLRIAAGVSGVLFPLIFFSFWQADGVVIGRFTASGVYALVGIIMLLRVRPR